MKQTTLVTRLALMLVMAGALVLAGCGGDDNGVRVETVEVPAEPIEVEVPAASEIEGVQLKAANAAAAAKMASDNAAMAVEAAMMATANLATMQTGAMSAMHAYNAKKYAKMAMDEYMKAKTASEAAAAATTTEAATTAKDMAEAAQMDADKYAMMVANEEMTGYADKAKKYAMMELKIAGTMKSVGDTTIDAMAGASTMTTGTDDNEQTVKTGLIADLNPEAMGDAIQGAVYMPATVDDLSMAGDERELDNAVAETMLYKQAAQARMFAVGKTLDSSDDMARLMLVTHYAGTNMVRVFAPANGTDAQTGSKAGFISLDRAGEEGASSDTAANANNTALRSLGMFYPADGPTEEPNPVLINTFSIADDAKPVEVFSYTYPVTDMTTEPDTVSTTTVYATLTSISTDSVGAATYTYDAGVDITALMAVPDGPDAETEPDEGQVTVPIPGPVAYQHLHFGVWTSLGMAAKDGSQKVTDLGIGFVQSIGDGMTGADMPNAGMGTYNGNWAATVETATGAVSLEHGAAELTADFVKATLKAELTGLAMLEGTLDGSMFSGTKATVGANDHGLASGGKFTGEFSGGFYGEEAVEAGSTFDFSSTSSGAFRGALGGRKMP